MAEPVVTNGFPPYAGGLEAREEQLDLRAMLVSFGTSGLRQAGGWIREEWSTEIGQGIRAYNKYREMSDNSGVIGASLFAIQMLIRQVEWRLHPAEDSAAAQAAAELVSGMLFRDLDQSWSMVLSEALSFLPYGYSLMEIVLKRRQGLTPPDLAPGLPALPSIYEDGYIGIGSLSQRSQDTILRWQYDAVGRLQGAHQLDPFAGKQAFLPLAKCVHFRPSSYKQNPEGRSILRSAYRSYYLATHVENTEMVGVERDLVGLGMFTVPPQWMSSSATPEEQAQLDMVKRIVRNVLNDEQAGLVVPAIYDQDGNQLLKFELLTSGGRRMFDTSKILERLELRIAQSLLTDLIFLGHETVGSFALASSKTTTLAMALAGFLQVITDEFNRKVIPLLWRLNAFDPALMPTLCHGDIESLDLKDLSSFLTAYAGVPSFDLTDVENHIRGLAGFPERQETPAEGSV
jgi:hypothetical protein